MKRFLVALSISVASLASTSNAGEILHTTTVGPIATGGTATFTVPPFDSSVGVLRAVAFLSTASITGRIGFENTSATTWVFGGYQAWGSVRAQVPWQIAGLTGATPSPIYYPPATMLPTYDGTTDYGGVSGVTFTYQAPAPDGTSSAGGYFYDQPQLQSFAGASPAPVEIGPVTRFGPSSTGGLLVTDVMSVYVTVTVRYVYDAFPAQICGALWTSGCPCGNHSITGADRGCRNSTGSSGLLLASGSASLANDTLTLSGSGMTNSSALYFQGTSFGYTQTPYGDGLLCVTGNIVRLGAPTNVGGSSQVPGGTPISTLGGVTAPGTRFYQVVYRDLGSFCTPSTFNTTSAMAIAWSL